MEIHEVAKSLNNLIPILQDKIINENGSYSLTDEKNQLEYGIFGYLTFQSFHINLFDINDNNTNHTISYRKNVISYTKHNDAHQSLLISNISLDTLKELEDGRDDIELILTYGKEILFLKDEIIIKMIEFVTQFIKDIK